MHNMHEDKADECQVCIVLNNFQSADIPSFSIEIVSLNVSFTLLSPKTYNAVSYINKGYYSTAPPHSSFI